MDRCPSISFRKRATNNAMVMTWLSCCLIVGTLIVFNCGMASGEQTASRMPVITILYDNTPYKKYLETAWGFSCLVEVMNTSILFDTGGNGRMLLANMRKLGIVPQMIDAVVISHIHSDHAGGLYDLLRRNSRAVTFLPASFPVTFTRNVEKLGSQVVSVHGPRMICNNVFSIGELGTIPREQSLVVNTKRGLVIVTGCAHPGIERIVSKSKELFGGEVLLIAGGFHLSGCAKTEIEAVIAGLKMLGVRHVAPCHCTGDVARGLFKHAFGSGFIDVGVGKVIYTEGLR
ncbi:MAG TPA: MBL fold metallo-hydrolase [Geobacter sp.]|nr:MBL fold metallo-hydrolase [Geobacter sp.]